MSKKDKQKQELLVTLNLGKYKVIGYIAKAGYTTNQDGTVYEFTIVLPSFTEASVETRSPTCAKTINYWTPDTTSFEIKVHEAIGEKIYAQSLDTFEAIQ